MWETEHRAFCHILARPGLEMVGVPLQWCLVTGCLEAGHEGPFSAVSPAGVAGLRGGSMRWGQLLASRVILGVTVFLVPGSSISDSTVQLGSQLCRDPIYSATQQIHQRLFPAPSSKHGPCSPQQSRDWDPHTLA